MRITLTKPPMPLLWLDTWCILEIAAALDSKDLKRKEYAEKVVEKIIALTRKKKLLCPKGDQDIEISVSSNKKIVERCREIQLQISLGISLNIYAAVEYLQIQRMMKAVIEKQPEVEFPWKDIFADDPVWTIDRNDRFLVSVHIPQSQEQTNQQLSVHKSIAEDWENLRQSARTEKRDYQTILSREFRGAAETIIHVMSNIAAKTIHKLPISDEEFMQSEDIVGMPLSWWEHYSGKEDVLKEVIEFYASTEYSQIPYVNVGTRLLAELVSGNEKVSPSDVMDIHHISTVLPYATYMVVDKRVRNRMEGKTLLAKDYPVKLLKWTDVLPLLESLGR